MESTATKMFRINKKVYYYLKSRYTNVNAAIVALIQAQDKSFNAIEFINDIDKNQLDIFQGVAVGEIEATEQGKPGASRKGKSS
jgi:hypothetical protein